MHLNPTFSSFSAQPRLSNCPNLNAAAGLAPQLGQSSLETRSRRLGRASDNTFQTARSFGVVRRGSRSVTYRVRGTVGRFDPIDVQKLTILPGANYFAGDIALKISGGPLQVSSFGQLGPNAAIQPTLQPITIAPGSYNYPNVTFAYNQTTAPIFNYSRFSSSSSRVVRYELKITFRLGNSSGS